MDRFVELTVVLPVSQYVRVEAAANGNSRSLESTASFLLSEWVLATHSRKHGDSNCAMPGVVQSRPRNGTKKRMVRA